MTGALLYDPRRYYTVEEFAALPEDTSARYELQDGVVVMSPRPTPLHSRIQTRLIALLDSQIPEGLVLLNEVDVDLQLSSPVVRVPDLVIARESVVTARIAKAADVLLAIEIVSPGSGHMDTAIKPMEYADAGIPHYWVIDPNPPVTATVYHLIDGAYEESQRAEGPFMVSEPCPLTADLDGLGTRL